MFNPFDLRGPQFIFFYLMFGAAVIALLRFMILQKEKKLHRGGWDYTDPYKLAYLRGGVNEALRVTLFSLIDRGLIKAAGEMVASVGRGTAYVSRPIEQAVLNVFSIPREVKELFDDATAAAVAERYRLTLAADNLISNDTIIAGRSKMALSALFLLTGISFIKILVAISRGRYNLGFLVILTIVFSVSVIAVWRMKRTGAGDEAMRELGLRFHILKLRAATLRPGGMTNEAAILAAVFGLAVLPGDYFPYINTLFPKTASPDNSSGGCGSSGCGSSGCGGGGCGGGCGGCGG